MPEFGRLFNKLQFSWIARRVNDDRLWDDFHNLDAHEKREKILSFIFHLRLDVPNIQFMIGVGPTETGLINYLCNGLLNQFTTPSATQTAARKLEVMFVNLSLDPSYVAANWWRLHYLRNKFRRDGTPRAGPCPSDQNRTICGCWGTPTMMKNVLINTIHVDRILEWQIEHICLEVRWDLTEHDEDNEDDEDGEDDEEIVPPAQDVLPVDNIQDAQPVDNLQHAPAVENVRDVLPVRNVQDALAVGNAQDDLPVRNVKDAPVVDNVQDAPAVHSIQDDAPIENDNPQPVVDPAVQENDVSGNAIAEFLESSAQPAVTDNSPLLSELVAVFLEAKELCSKIRPTVANVVSSLNPVPVVTLNDEPSTTSIVGNSAFTSNQVPVITIRDSEDSEYEEQSSVHSSNSVVLIDEDTDASSDAGVNHQVDGNVQHSVNVERIEPNVEVRMDQDPVVTNHEFGSGLIDGFLIECSQEEVVVAEDGTDEQNSGLENCQGVITETGEVGIVNTSKQRNVGSDVCAQEDVTQIVESAKDDNQNLTDIGKSSEEGVVLADVVEQEDVSSGILAGDTEPYETQAIVNVGNQINLETRTSQDTDVEVEQQRTVDSRKDKNIMPNMENKKLGCSRTENVEHFLDGSSSSREQTIFQANTQLTIPDDGDPLGQTRTTGSNQAKTIISDGSELPCREIVSENLEHSQTLSHVSNRDDVNGSEQMNSEELSTVNDDNDYVSVAQDHGRGEILDEDHIKIMLEQNQETVPGRDSHDSKSDRVSPSHGNIGLGDNHKIPESRQLQDTVEKQKLEENFRSEDKEMSLRESIVDEKEQDNVNCSKPSSDGLSSSGPKRVSLCQDSDISMDNNSKYDPELMPKIDYKVGISEDDSNCRAIRRLQMFLKEQQLNMSPDSVDEDGCFEKSIVERQEEVEGLKPQDNITIVEDGTILSDQKTLKIGFDGYTTGNLKYDQSIGRGYERDGSGNNVNTPESRTVLEPRGCTRRRNWGHKKMSSTEDEIHSNVMRILRAAQQYLPSPTSNSEIPNVIPPADTNFQPVIRNRQSEEGQQNEVDAFLPRCTLGNEEDSSQMSVEDFIRKRLVFPFSNNPSDSQKIPKNLTKIGHNIYNKSSKESFTKRRSRLVELVTPVKQLAQEKRAKSSRKRLLQLDESGAPSPKIAQENQFFADLYKLVNNVSVEHILDEKSNEAEEEASELKGIDRVLQDFLEKRKDPGHSQ